MSKIVKNIGFAAGDCLKLTGRRYPLSVTFISTYRCNFTCSTAMSGGTKNTR